jgi:hypothetical protein
MLYTSSFQHIQNHPLIKSKEFRAMSIALHAPSGWNEDNQIYSLRPWPFMELQYSSGVLSKIGYEIRYRECILKNVSAQWILSYYDNCIMCCNEDTENWCHRRIVSKWILEKTGVIIPELDFNGNDFNNEVVPVFKPKEDVAIQMSLF